LDESRRCSWRGGEDSGGEEKVWNENGVHRKKDI